MDYISHDFGHIFSCDIDALENVVDTGKMNVQAFRLRKETTAFIWFAKQDIEEKKEGHIFVMEGSVQVNFPLEKRIVKAGEALSVMTTDSFSIYALEASSFFWINNMTQTDISENDIINKVILLEKKDRYTRGHNSRVGRYTAMIIYKIKPDYQGTDAIFAASCHDVGKTGIPEEILNKPGKLTEEEYAMIKEHPKLSYDILKENGEETVAKYARWHHERLDGTGYPDGLKADEIPFECKAMAVADVFDALTTARSYRGALTFAQALEIMEKEVIAGKLDGECFGALKTLIELGCVDEGFDDQIHK